MSDRVTKVSDFLGSDHSHLHKYPGQSTITLRNLFIRNYVQYFLPLVLPFLCALLFTVVGLLCFVLLSCVYLCYLMCVVLLCVYCCLKYFSCRIAG